MGSFIRTHSNQTHRQPHPSINQAQTMLHSNHLRKKHMTKTERISKFLFGRKDYREEENLLLFPHEQRTQSELSKRRMRTLACLSLIIFLIIGCFAAKMTFYVSQAQASTFYDQHFESKRQLLGKEKVKVKDLGRSLRNHYDREHIHKEKCQIDHRAFMKEVIRTTKRPSLNDIQEAINYEFQQSKAQTDTKYRECLSNYECDIEKRQKQQIAEQHGEHPQFPPPPLSFHQSLQFRPQPKSDKDEDEKTVQAPPPLSWEMLADAYDEARRIHQKEGHDAVVQFNFGIIEHWLQHYGPKSIIVTVAEAQKREKQGHNNENFKVWLTGITDHCNTYIQMVKIRKRLLFARQKFPIMKEQTRTDIKERMLEDFPDEQILFEVKKQIISGGYDDFIQWLHGIKDAIESASPPTPSTREDHIHDKGKAHEPPSLHDHDRPQGEFPPPPPSLRERPKKPFVRIPLLRPQGQLPQGQ